MLRFLGVILLSLCVLAMPSYAAITCGTTCASTSDAHEHDCCPEIAATIGALSADDAGAPHDSNHSDTGGRHHHCAAPCCSYVAHVLSASAIRVEEKPLAALLPTAAALQGSVNHDAIFHPPRI